MRLRRRDFLRSGGTFLAGSWLGGSLLRTASAGVAGVQAGPSPYGGLQEPDENGIMLPPGFTSRVVAESGFEVGDTGYVWHTWPDGGAVFDYGPEWVYVSNSEFPILPRGGVGALRFDRHGEVIGAYPILEDTLQNCAGGATSWGTWLSCEEHPRGRVWECDPRGLRPPVAHGRMGRFAHEAVAQDPGDPRVFYLTEDVGDGGFYRFTSDRVRDLSSGVLEIAEVTDDGSGGPGGHVVWHEVPKPAGRDTPTRYQVASATPFDGGEGIVSARRKLFFTTKGDDRVWAYDPARHSLRVHYDAAISGGPLSGVDNITSAPTGDLYVAEDGGNMEIVLLSAAGTASPLLRVIGQDHSEVAGPAFDRRFQRLYFSSQRGGAFNSGITYEIRGHFLRARGCGGLL